MAMPGQSGFGISQNAQRGDFVFWQISNTKTGARCLFAKIFPILILILIYSNLNRMIKVSHCDQVSMSGCSSLLNATREHFTLHTSVLS